MSPLLQSILSAEFGFAIFRVMTPLLFAAIGVGLTAFLLTTFNVPGSYGTFQASFL